MSFVKRIFILYIIVNIFILGGCAQLVDKEDEVKYYTDVSFVQFKFPEIKEIESTKFSYIEKKGRGIDSIGLVPTFFEGIIVVSKEYADEIYNKYKWESVAVKIPESLYNKSCDFLYSPKYDSLIKGSLVGEMFFCKKNNIIYFKGEY